MEYQQQPQPGAQPQDNYNYDYDYDQNEGAGRNDGTKGLKIAIAILLIVLAAVSYLFWSRVQQANADKDELAVARDTLESQLGVIQKDMDLIKFDNDTLNQHLVTERFKADSLMKKMRSERNVSYAKIKRYERELSTLRNTMQSFVRQIDSLGRLTKKLTGENLAYRKELSTYRLRTEAAEETATELNSKIKRGAVVRARDITLRAVNAKDKDVTRAGKAKRLITTFILAGNDLAQPGDRTVYASIVNPDGIVLAESQNTVFNFEGQNIPFTNSRQVDYQGEDLPVSIFYNGSGITAGSYTVMVYMDGHLIGTNAIIMR